MLNKFSSTHTDHSQDKSTADYERKKQVRHGPCLQGVYNLVREKIGILLSQHNKMMRSKTRRT
jgi:hypothetical protein